MMAMDTPCLNPLLAAVIPLSRPVARPEPRTAAAPIEVAASAPEEQSVLGVECALPEGFSPY